MAGRRRERFLYVLVTLLALAAVAVIIVKAVELGWSDSATGSGDVEGHALAAAFFSFL